MQANRFTDLEGESLVAHGVQINPPFGLGEKINSIRRVKLLRAVAFVEVEEVLVLRELFPKTPKPQRYEIELKLLKS